MKLKEGFILREVAGECVVIPSGDQLDLNMMITLNETGKTLWKVLERGAELPELVNALTGEYDVDEDTAHTHAQAFVDKLKEHDFLV